MVFNIAKEKEQIDFKRNKFIFQYTLTKPELVQRYDISFLKVFDCLCYANTITAQIV